MAWKSHINITIFFVCGDFLGLIHMMRSVLHVMFEVEIIFLLMNPKACVLQGGLARGHPQGIHPSECGWPPL